MREQMFWGQIPFTGGRIALEVESDRLIPNISDKYPRLADVWEDLKLLADEIAADNAPGPEPYEVIKSETLAGARAAAEETGSWIVDHFTVQDKETDE